MLAAHTERDDDARGGALKDRRSGDDDTTSEGGSLAGSGSDATDDEANTSRNDKGKGTAAEEDEEEDADAEEDDENDEDEDEDDEDDSDDEDEEPRLKYARLTTNLGGLYRNGDATSAFLVAGDKMIVGTHNGNIHVFQLPTFQPLRVYHAHSASVTAISISPFTPPLPTLKIEQINRIVAEGGAGGGASRPGSSHASPSPNASPRKAREPPPILNIPSNNIHIATASTDGNVCIQSLIDIKDVQLRNFGRPVQAVALSPEYRQDRTYLSGGLAGNLIVTVCGQSGRSTSTTVGTAAATASGWLGSMGLGNNAGRDTVLHSGEGTVNNIQWSVSGRYVAWLNEHGIKIMRTRLHLDSADAEGAWKRIGHVDRPQTEEWDTMASVWKGRAQWIDETMIDADDDVAGQEIGASAEPGISSPAAEVLRQQQARDSKAIERLLVGWGSTIWMVHVHAGRVKTGKHAGERSVGHAEIVKILRMDCIISGISLYTQNLLLVLAYTPADPEEDEDEGGHQAAGKSKSTYTRGHKANKSTASSSSEPTGGIRRRQNNNPPELRLIDLTSQTEVDKDVLSVSRYERLSAGDYHLSVLPAQTAAAAAVSSKGALEAIAGLGADMWNAALNPSRMLFSSGQSVKSKDSNEGTTTGSSKAASMASTLRVQSRLGGLGGPSVHPSLATTGIKIFMHSPYDCILATRRDLSDHLAWLLEHQEFQQAWELVNENPDAVPSYADRSSDLGTMTPDQSTQPTQASVDFYPDAVLDALSREANAPAEREKRRIGELWIKEIVDTGDWERAGQVAGKVLRSSDRWEKWVWTFAGADQFDAITNYIPTEPLHPPIPRTIYEIVLGHYLKQDKPRFRELLERWPTELFDINTIVTALENQLNYRDVREDSVEDGERGRDWRIVMESLARLHEANGRYREALKAYIRLQDADSAFRLIRDNHLADAVIDDIPSFIALRVPAGRADKMTRAELEEATAEAMALLVDEAQHGLVQPASVVAQLQAQDLNLYIFLYFRGLWQGEGLREHQRESHDRLALESKAQLDGFADLAVQLFAQFGDRALLMEFLKASTSYSFEQAAAACERHKYIDELVYLYSKTGQMKRALYLIIDRLGDVSQAIAFAKEQDDPDLWEDLLNYSMDKPRFIRGLLEEVGTAIDPITLVRRIPEGLAVEGLRDGLQHIMKEHEIQHSISSGVARVLRSEVATAQATLRNGQRKGIRFEVVAPSKVAPAVSSPVATATIDAADGDEKEQPAWTPGHCARCLEAFTEWDRDTLVGFACGHVFHLTHLLGKSTAEVEELGFGVDDELISRHNITATKIMHARLLRDHVRDGCPVCVKPTAVA
ncbi:vacuolar assembly protein [Sporothrix brasiliensis 5110]|uniref:Vacuolar assembly protein n=1 Tax=Sporothrix brasiliensis 5110 TaxID=1398154 RepID=A0A0C2F4L9_9PEZI|nr:vacuolar assembly protein [Sporothrix brasiliensis 5110]KIH93864.1 vacuolar assembly protein [Sporothrix brasiliensis 5110]